MVRKWAPVAAAALWAAVWASPGLAGLKEALQAAGQDNWTKAASEAAAEGGPAPLVVEWMRLRDRDTKTDFSDYRRFIAEHSDFPGIDLLRQRGETAMNATTPRADVLAYFRGYPPQTATGAYWLAIAQAAEGQQKSGHETLIRAWRTLPVGGADQALYLGRYAQLLAPHHTARMDNALWRGAWSEVQAMLPYVGKDWQALAKARQALRQDLPGVDSLVAAVPKSLQGDPGLAFERMAWRARRDWTKEAAQVILAQSASGSTLGRPEMWADRRERLARQILREGDAQTAYKLAARHQLQPGSDYAELEWLAGYAALTGLRDPNTALTHFKRVRTAVTSPISLGRAGYWEGRAYDALGQREQARAAYAFAAEYQTSFYGQLAAERGGIAPDARLAGGEKFPDGANAPFRNSMVYRAGVALHDAGALELSARFFSHLAESLDRAQIGSMAARLEVLDEPYIQLAIAKRAATMGHTLHRAYFPLMKVDTRASPDVAPELALSIARRESEFNPRVVSPAGARGLMQLMPATAQAMAGSVGEKYSLGRLTSDPAYNAKLGTAYLQRLRGQFGGATMMVAAGYNAGPGRPKSWVQQYGDPRGSDVDPVNWLESIPFEETRTYVMRVMESLAPYRARLSGKTGPLGLTEALAAR